MLDSQETKIDISWIMRESVCEREMVTTNLWQFKTCQYLEIALLFLKIEKVETALAFFSEIFCCLPVCDPSSLVCILTS